MGAAGYAEPTLVVLHEAEPTWSARLALRRDTCRLSVHSINLAQRRHPLLWSATDLPSDAFKAVPVPLPVGGVVVLCTNSIIYHNQVRTVERDDTEETQKARRRLSAAALGAAKPQPLVSRLSLLLMLGGWDLGALKGEPHTRETASKTDEKRFSTAP